MTDRWGVGLLVTTVLVVLSGSAIAGVAGTTDVRVEPERTTVNTGETVTMALFVTDAANGVGAFDVTATVEDGAVAIVEEINVVGEPAFVDEAYENENASVRITASGLNTSDRGSVSILEVRLRARSPGQTDLNVSVTALGDEDGSEYEVQSVRSGRLDVEQSADGTDRSTPSPTPPRTASHSPATAESPTNSPTTTAGTSESPVETTMGETTAASTEAPSETATPTGNFTTQEPDPSLPESTDTSTLSPRETEPAAEDEANGDSGDNNSSIGVPLAVIFGVVLVALVASGAVWYSRT